MQPPAFLWFEMEMTKRYLREKTFGPIPSPADSAGSKSQSALAEVLVTTLSRTCCARVPASSERCGNQTDTQQP
jgi:hypothetical protein